MYDNCNCTLCTLCEFYASFSRFVRRYVVRGSFFLSAVSLIGLNASAGATDLSAPQKPQPAPRFVRSSAWAPGASWAGFYLGNHLGGNWANFAVAEVQHGVKLNNAMSRVTGGGHFGYNLQGKRLIYGAEVDLGGMNLGHSARLPGTVGHSLNSGYYGDITGRIGSPYENLLLYAKGGFAFYEGSSSIVASGTEATRASGLNGWTAGGGLEFRLTPVWSAKAEYSYFQFGRESLETSSGSKYDADLTVQSVTAGFNYHLP